MKEFRHGKVWNFKKREMKPAVFSGSCRIRQGRQINTNDYEKEELENTG